MKIYNENDSEYDSEYDYKHFKISDFPLQLEDESYKDDDCFDNKRLRIFPYCVQQRAPPPVRLPSKKFQAFIKKNNIKYNTINDEEYLDILCLIYKEDNDVKNKKFEIQNHEKEYKIIKINNIEYVEEIISCIEEKIKTPIKNWNVIPGK